MEVVTEGLDERDRLLAAGAGLKVAREEDKGHKADVVRGAHALALELQRRLRGERRERGGEGDREANKRKSVDRGTCVTS